MEVQKRLYTVDDVCELQGWDGTRDRKYELIDGELIEMSPTNLLHQWLASELSGEIRNYAKRNDLGFVGVEGGFSPIDNRHTLLAPDVAFVRKDRMPQPLPQTFAGFMPYLAVAIASPSNTIAELREKAATYLQHGSRMVWLVFPDQNGVEVCRQGDEERITFEFVGPDGSLSGEDMLPGFELEMAHLFPTK